MSTFEAAAIQAAPALGAATICTLADRIAAGWPANAVLAGIGDAVVEAARPVLFALEHEEVPAGQSAAFLRVLAAGYALQTTSVSVETVWSGPISHSVPVRANAQALIEVVSEATGKLVLMTYSAKRHEPLRDALTSAVERASTSPPSWRRCTARAARLPGRARRLAGHR